MGAFFFDADCHNPNNPSTGTYGKAEQKHHDFAVDCHNFGTPFAQLATVGQVWNQHMNKTGRICNL